MIDIIYRLNAIYQFHKSSHWLAKDYQHHLLFEKLYEGIDEEIDTLAEILLELGEDKKSFAPQVMIKESLNFIPQSAIKGEEELLKEIQKIKADKVPVGLYNHLATIAEKHTKNLSLLRYE